MDGGVDAAIIRYFGPQLMRRVQQRILDEYFGEQPIGTAIIVETGNDRHPYLAHTPTMRVPSPITDTENVYYAMWAMLIAVHQHNRQAIRPITIIACPGLGTATGEMRYAEAARQMAVAYRHYLKPPDYISWTFAEDRHLRIRYGTERGG